MISYAFPKKVVDASEDHLFSLVLPSGRIPLLLQGLTTAFFNPLVSGRFGFVPVAAWWSTIVRGSSARFTIRALGDQLAGGG
jgi:hypothetical protein